MKKSLLLMAVVLLFSIPLFSKTTIKRVEPAFWWAGMKNTGLQIMVYGENISALAPAVSHSGVEIERVVHVKSPNYLFLYLRIDRETKPGTFKIDFLKKGKVELSYDYELLQREEGSAERMGYDNSDVIYLITPDRFANGDPSNDNMPGMKEQANRQDKDGRHGGDIRGIISHLDYIEDMGFTALWLNPTVENNMSSTSYHGYAITDFYRTDPRYGSNDDYVSLVEESGDRGIKVIMDMILNHCGSEHWWMDDLPCDDWINYQDGWQPTTHLRETNVDPYASAYDKKRHADGWFVESMPDLNQRNPLLADYLIYNTIWWIEYAHLSGIRMDTYPYPDKDFMSEWTKRVMQEYPNFNMVGEEWSVNPAIVSYWQRGKHNQDGYVSYLPGVFDFPLQEALVKALNEDDGQWGQGLIRLYAMLTNDFLYADPSLLVTFPDNHDMSRFYTQINEDFDLYKMGMAYIMVTRGIPQIYYGTEILMSNPHSGSHGEIRGDFPGGWDGDSVNAFNRQGLSAGQGEAQDFVKRLLNWRKSCETVHEGHLKHFAPAASSGIYTMFRYDDAKAVMLIMNKNAEEKTVDLGEYRREVIGQARQAYDIIHERELELGDSLKVEARSIMLVELDLNK